MKNKKITEKGIKEARAGYFPTLGAYATAERYNDLSNCVNKYKLGVLNENMGL